MLEYAQSLGANEEVLEWTKNVVGAKLKKATETRIDQREVEHIIDFLVSDAAPTRLRKMSYEQALAAAEKWSKAKQKKGKDLIDSDEDLETIYQYKNGSRVVRLKTKKAYEREGALMKHCVGGYTPEKTTIYSYRDPANNPHATIELKGKEIMQIKGKTNGPVLPKYIHDVLEFLVSQKVNVRTSEMENLGYIHVTPEAEKLLAMFSDSKGEARIIEALGKKYVVKT